MNYFISNRKLIYIDIYLDKSLHDINSYFSINFVHDIIRVSMLVLS